MFSNVPRPFRSYSLNLQMQTDSKCVLLQQSAVQSVLVVRSGCSRHKMYSRNHESVCVCCWNSMGGVVRSSSTCRFHAIRRVVLFLLLRVYYLRIDLVSSICRMQHAHVAHGPLYSPIPQIFISLRISLQARCEVSEWRKYSCSSAGNKHSASYTSHCRRGCVLIVVGRYLKQLQQADVYGTLALVVSAVVVVVVVAVYCTFNPLVEN